MSIPNIYSKHYTLTTNYYNQFNNLSIQGSFDLLQNIAAHHAYLLNAGRQHLEAKGIFWIIARNQIEYVTFPLIPTEVEIMTWPLKPTRFYFDRCYKAIDKTTGKLIFISRSRWVLVDINTRKIVGSDRYNYPLENIHEEILFENDIPHPSTGSEIVGTYIVRPSDIDENGHVNNSKYGNIIYDYLNLSGDQKVKEVTISYHNEIVLGDSITIKKSVNNSKITISGHKNDIIIFASEVAI